ncbi:thermonuclease family protein [Pseudoroseicyclus sp. CXY001]|uniref:thermonuclease family protein n=1 Tax=Pseudoroseicyclus sp. CXY001 TaxID=3242492 RepID=UPI003570E6DA
MAVETMPYLLLTLVAFAALRLLRPRRRSHPPVPEVSPPPTRPWRPTIPRGRPPDAPWRPILQGRAHVVDGDGLVIRGTHIRLFGIDAPEMSHPLGPDAKSALIQLVRGRHVTAEVLHTDRHGRAVAQCHLPDGRDLSAEMVRCGMAIDWPKHSGGRYSALEPPGTRQRLWLADARQRGRMDVWAAYEAGRQMRP